MTEYFDFRSSYLIFQTDFPPPPQTMLKYSHNVRLTKLNIVLGVGRGRRTPKQSGRENIKRPKSFATDRTSYTLDHMKTLFVL